MTDVEHSNTKPMTPTGRAIFEALFNALEMHTPEPQVPINLRRDLELSIELDAIAIALMKCWWLKAGLNAGAVEPTWEKCSHELRERYRRLAERAIQTLDPQVRLDAKDQAAQETAAFIDSAGDMTFNAKTWALIAHEAISRYESRLASLRVTGGDE